MEKEDVFPLSCFQLHFDLSKRNAVVEFLKSIQQELSSRTHIHDWDHQFSTDPVETLVASAKREFEHHDSRSCDYILSSSNVDRICTVNGLNHRRYFARGAYGDVAQFLAPVDVICNLLEFLSGSDQGYRRVNGQKHISSRKVFKATFEWPTDGQCESTTVLY